MDCIFCKIIAGQIPSVKIREDEDFLAILDAFPNREGQALLIPKQHFGGDVFQIDNNNYSKLMMAAKKVVELMKNGLGVDRVGIVIEGLEVDHAHIRMYPFYDNIGFANGVASGPKADMAKLEAIADQIKNNN